MLIRMWLSKCRELLIEYHKSHPVLFTIIRYPLSDVLRTTAAAGRSSFDMETVP